MPSPTKKTVKKPSQWLMWGTFDKEGKLLQIKESRRIAQSSYEKNSGCSVKRVLVKLQK